MTKKKLMLLLTYITYTPREDIDLKQYHTWLRDVDNPFWNSHPAVKHYTNWHIVDQKLGSASFTHFDLLSVEDPDGFEIIFGDEAIVAFAKEWVRKWGKLPDPELSDQSVNYHTFLCEQIAGPDAAQMVSPRHLHKIGLIKDWLVLLH